MSRNNRQTYPRVVSPSMKRKLRARVCRICGSQGSITAHHLVPVKAGRQDVPQNLIPLCQTCHTRIDGPKTFERDVMRRTLRGLLLADEIEYARRRMGKEWLNYHYPLAQEFA